MPKKTTVLILTLFLFTIGLIYIAVRTEQQNPSLNIEEEPLTEEETQNLIPTINPQTSISFTPETVDAITNPQGLYTVDVIANTNGQSISGIQLELSYDPALLTNVTITPSENNLFGQNPAILINNIDPDLGRITYVISLGGLNDEEVSGNGSIATLTFNAVASEIRTTEISILPKTTVRSLRSTNSLLNSSSPLTISLPESTQIVPQTLPLESPTPLPL